MSTTDTAFHRYLSPKFLEALETLLDKPEGQWWRDVLSHPDLFLAVRTNTLNAYHRGGSIFRIRFEGGQIQPTTHIKYLVRQRQAYARMSPEGSFGLRAEEVLWTAYDSPATLKEMIAAARALAGPEKTGLHALIMTNPQIIDVEVAFSDTMAPPGEADEVEPTSADDIDVLGNEDEGEKAEKTASVDQPIRRQDRLDAVSLEDRNGDLWIVFHEAKHFANVELRAGAGRTPPVLEQIARYRQAIQRHQSNILDSYRDVCRAKVHLHEMRLRAVQAAGGAEMVMPLDPLIVRAADGEALHLDPEPRLIVFGFDQDQKDGEIWRRHHSRLAEELGSNLYAVGNPANGGKAAFKTKAQ